MLPNDNPDLRRSFQKGLDENESRRRRHDDRLRLRKKNRTERLNKRRKKNSFNPTLNLGPNKDKGQKIPEYIKLENLPKFVEKVNSNKFDEVFFGVQSIRQLLSVEENPPIKEIFESKVLTKLLSIMEKKIPRTKENQQPSQRAQQMIKLQFEAAWAVTNVASGDPKFTVLLVKMNAIKSFMTLLENTKDIETADQAIWGLGNIAGDCPRLRDEVLNTNVLDYILKNLFEFPVPMRRNAVWTVSNFCRGKPSPDWEKVKPILKPIAKLLSQTRDYDIIVDILWAISFLSEDRASDDNSREEESVYGPSFQINAVLETEVIKYVIHLIEHSGKMGSEAFAQIQKIRQEAHEKGVIPVVPDHIKHQLSTSDFVTAPCVRILGNIVSGTDEQTQKVVDDGFYQVIELCIGHRVCNVRKEACWALSNVVAGTQNQLDRFFDRPSLVKKTVGLALNSEVNVKKEAGWCLSNAICGATYDQVRLLVKARFLEAMVGLLNLHGVEKIMRMAMEALEGCIMSYFKMKESKGESFTMHDYNPFAEKIEELGGLNALEEIQSLETISEDTWNQAAELVQKFWGSSDNRNFTQTGNDNFGESWDDHIDTNDNDNMVDDNDNDMDNNNGDWTNNDGFGEFDGGFDDDETQNINDDNLYEF